MTPTFEHSVTQQLPNGATWNSTWLSYSGHVLPAHVQHVVSWSVVKLPATGTQFSVNGY